MCPALTIEHGRVSITGDIADGKSVTVACVEGYQLEGSDTITCTGGIFNNDVPTCKKGFLVNIMSSY